VKKFGIIEDLAAFVNFGPEARNTFGNMHQSVSSDYVVL